jgi:hypothetical protein
MIFGDGRGLASAMIDHRDRTYAELGVPPETEDALERWQRTQPKPEPKSRERKLDTAPPTLDDVDRRIEERVAAEHERMMGILAELLAQLQSREEMRGPPGLAGPPGEQGPPGKLPLVKLWTPETVYYEGDVVSHEGGTFQAKRDTGQPPPHATGYASPLPAGMARALPCAARSTRTQAIVVSRSSPATAAASLRSRMHRVPARVPAGSCWRARASAAVMARRDGAASAARRVIEGRAARRFRTGRSIGRATSQRL